VAVDVTTETVIARPRVEVAAFAPDPENATRWYRNIESVEWKTTPPLAVGSRIAFVARFLGRRLAYTYEVRELVTGERFVMATAEGPFPMETTYEWSDTPEGATRMTLRNRGEPSGFGRIAAPFMASAIRRANERDLKQLKRILEADAANVDVGA
jgi:Polyketide cyclase / dehydrase and lipid transport